MSDHEIVWGARNIGRVINRSPRQTHYLLQQGVIQAARRIGTLWCASRAGLLSQFGGDTAAAMPTGGTSAPAAMPAVPTP